MEKDNIWFWVIIGILILLIFGGFGMGGFGMMGGFGLFGPLFMLLFWGAIIWLIVSLINATQSKKEGGQNALTILKNRYAKGEISKEQYDEMKKELET